MRSRRDTYLKEKRKKLKGKLVGTVFLIGIISGSYTVAFAEADIEMLLIQWFDKQKVESIEKIEMAINKERDVQTDRLKQELQLEIDRADQAIEEFTDEEIQQRIENLQVYTDELIKTIDIDDTKEKERITDQIHKIYNRAVEQLSKVKVQGTPNNDDDKMKELENPIDKETPPIDGGIAPEKPVNLDDTDSLTRQVHNTSVDNPAMEDPHNTSNESSDQR